MSIRLIKVSKELNVGISSLVEFLEKKGVQIKANPNTKINDEHYEMLNVEFGKDKKIRKTVEKQREKQLSKEKKETVAIEGYDIPDQKQKKSEEKESRPTTSLSEENKPQVKVVGSIDLDTLKPIAQKEQDRKKEKEKPEAPKPKEKTPSPETKVEKEKKVEKTVKANATSKEEEAKPIQGPKKEVKKTAQEEEEKQASKKDTKVEMKEIAEEPKKPTKAKKAEKEEKTTSPATKKTHKSKKAKEVEDDKEVDNNLFRLKDTTIEPNIVVKGTIDLDSINERTRPVRKTRAQRKKERLERERKKGAKKTRGEDEQRAEDSSDSTRRKRRRIRKGRVNVEREETSRTTRRRRPVLKKPVKKEVSEEDVQKQIKETLARLTHRKPGGRGGARRRRDRREAAIQRQQAEQKQQEKESRTLQLTEFVTANDLANMMDVPVTDVISTCMNMGVMVAINQRLDAETINIVADEYGFTTEFVSADVVEAITQEEDAEEDLISRSPIVTVMGHVDHGKTSLLDSIRETNVIAGEAGGITQHIGAYHVSLASGKEITFLDTPGHEAFTAMRARGAKVTDVAIIIIAADDNVMPQTVEAINHASAAGVPIVFAINKIDKPGANPEKVKEELAQMNYLVEEWGGKYQSQDISAKHGQGVPELLEKVLLEAEMLELQANPDRTAYGSVVESSLDKGRGYVSTVLVENGTLKSGDIILAGAFFGRIKAMFNERNQNIEKAGPAQPALVLGLNGAPQAGDKFHVLESEQEARSIANRREQLQREQSIRTQRILTLDDIGRRIAIGNFQELNIIVKGDVDGSVEALSDSLIELSTPEIQVNIIHKAVGQISDSDITLATASDAIIIGFQVRPSLTARREAEKHGIDIRLYSVIYDAIEEVTAAMEGMLSPDIKEEITANVEVLEIFKISKIGTIAGCIVRDGKIKRSDNVRLIRDGIVIYTGELESLKRFKDDVREVASGYECGLNIKNFNDIKVGDTVEAFEEVEVRKTL